MLGLLVDESNWSCFFLGSVYVHHSVFAESVDTSWRIEACGNINTTAYPLLTLLNMLEIKPYRKVINFSNLCFNLPMYSF